MEKSYYRLFEGTYKYYVKYRPEIPQKVVDLITDYFALKNADRVLDIGCGTGQVARAFEARCKEIVSVDADLEMLKWAKKNNGTSFAAPLLFSDKREEFKKDLKDSLLTIEPKGVFQEKAIWSIVLGRRKQERAF